MNGHAVAKARAANSLDEAARAIKRAQATLRTSLQVVRQAQAEVIGIEVETITDPGGHSANSNSEQIRQQTDRIVEEAFNRRGE